MRILVVEDDTEVATYIARGLTEAGHSVDRADEGREGMMLALEEPYDLVILDRNVPHIDGLRILRAMRAAGLETAVLVLSALGQIEDRVAGLRAGSDDYLVKPFAFSELLARVESLGRRVGSSLASETVLRLGDLEMDLLTRQVRRAHCLVGLKPQEFRLLEYLLRQQGRVVTRTMILEKVWNYHFDPQTNIIDVHISRLRRKIDPPESRPLLHTVRGVGYVLRL